MPRLVPGEHCTVPNEILDIFVYPVLPLLFQFSLPPKFHQAGFLYFNEAGAQTWPPPQCRAVQTWLELHAGGVGSREQPHDTECCRRACITLKALAYSGLACASQVPGGSEVLESVRLSQRWGGVGDTICAEYVGVFLQIMTSLGVRSIMTVAAFVSVNLFVLAVNYKSWAGLFDQTLS